MGLDVTAYSNCQFLGNDERFEREGSVYLYNNPSFPGRSDGMHTGYYSYEKKISGLCFSYGGYNRWRESLCQAMLGVEPNVVWDNYAKYKGKPFAELIYFSDCEGILGPITSRKLAQDFRWHRETFIKACQPECGLFDVDDSSFAIQQYDTFASFFALAADGGVVKFH